MVAAVTTKVVAVATADLMSARPAVVPVLLRHGLACPGCAMAPFMTVREAAEAYGLELDAFLADLAAADGRPCHSIEVHSTETR